MLIIGSGPAGYSAGVYASRAMLEPILIQGIEPGGQLTTTTEVENWPGDTEVQGPDLMLRMEAHAKAMGCQIIHDILRLDRLVHQDFLHVLGEQLRTAKVLINAMLIGGAIFDFRRRVLQRAPILDQCFICQGIELLQDELVHEAAVFQKDP